MSVQASTGFASAILGPAAFEQIFLNAVIEIRSGAQPSNSDTAVAGTLLGHITRDGAPFVPGNPANGLQFIRAGRFVLKEPTHTWKLKGVATGTAGHFRLLANAPDAGGISVSARRIDGAIGLDGELGDFQMLLPNLSITAATLIDVSSWILAIPPLGA